MIHVGPPIAVDLLASAIERVRPHLDPSQPISKRAQYFWAAVVAARDLAATDVVENEFRQLADVTDLTAQLGQEDIDHLIRWGILDLNPFC